MKSASQGRRSVCWDDAGTHQPVSMSAQCGERRHLTVDLAAEQPDRTLAKRGGEPVVP
jgi:hypothetical protein